jgi:AcrR family transcriptional regulator
MAKRTQARKAPKQERAKHTRDAIVEAAARVLADGGLRAFNTNAVAIRAGVSIGSLYQYFPNKDALMAALIHDAQARQMATVQSAMSTLASTHLPEMVRTLVRAAMQHHHDDPLLASAMDHEEARLPMQAELHAYIADSEQMIRALLQQHGDQIGSINPARAARTLPTLVRAVVDLWANLTPPQLDVAEDEAVRAVMGYLRSK